MTKYTIFPSFTSLLYNRTEKSWINNNRTSTRQSNINPTHVVLIKSCTTSFTFIPDDEVHHLPYIHFFTLQQNREELKGRRNVINKHKTNDMEILWSNLLKHFLCPHSPQYNKKWLEMGNLLMECTRFRCSIRGFCCEENSANLVWCSLSIDVNRGREWSDGQLLYLIIYTRTISDRGP